METQKSHYYRKLVTDNPRGRKILKTIDYHLKTIRYHFLIKRDEKTYLRPETGQKIDLLRNKLINVDQNRYFTEIDIV